jgi:hypothetical protein
MNQSPLWLRVIKRDKNAVLKQKHHELPGVNASLKIESGQYTDMSVTHLSILNGQKFNGSTTVHGNSNQAAILAAVAATAVGASVYSPKANAGLIGDLVEAISKAITKPLEKMSKMFTDTFSGMMDKGNQEQIVAFSKGFDSVNEMVKYSHNQKLFAESQPDPMHCEASERAIAGKTAQSHVESKKSQIETEMSNANVKTTHRVPSMVKDKNSWWSSFIGSLRNGALSFNNISPSVLRGQAGTANTNVDPSSPKAQTHTPASAKLATDYITAIRTSVDNRMENVDVSLLEKNDSRQREKVATVTAKKVRTAVLMQPFTDELAERTPIEAIGGKSKRELMHEGVANTYYSEDYNKQLTELSGATPALVAIAKSLSYSNMLAFEALQKTQQQNQLIAVLGVESMEYNSAMRDIV